MQESQIINGWIREGEIRGELRAKRENLLLLIELLVIDPVPDDIRLAIEGTNDLITLARWFDTAIDVETIENLRNAMCQAP